MYKCKNQQVWIRTWGAVGATLASECCHSGYVYSVRQLHVIYSVLKALEAGVQDREANSEIFSSNKIRRDEILIPTRSDLSGTVNPAQPQALINVFCSNAE